MFESANPEQYLLGRDYPLDVKGLIKPLIIDISKDRDFDLSKRKLGKKLRELKSNDPQKLMQMLSSLTEEEADSLLNDPMVLARDKQLISFEAPYTIGLWCAGRGFGKSYSLATMVKRAVEHYGVKKITALTVASRDARVTLSPAIEGLYSKNHPNKPEYKPSKAALEFPNGATVIFIPAEAGVDAPRGTQCELLIGDEIAFYPNAEEFITQALLTCRLGISKAVFATTPIAVEPLIKWIKRGRDVDDDYIAVINGSTFDNKDNLSKTFMETTVSSYKGTKYEAAELHGELVLENPSALWNMTTIDRNTLSSRDFPDNLTAIAIGVDPALTSKSTAAKGRTPDQTGIIVCGIDDEGVLYVLENHTISASVETWVNKIISVYDKWSLLYPVMVSVEQNAGGIELLSSAFDKARRGFQNRIKFSHSSASKLQRAMPYSLLAEQNKVKYMEGGDLQDLFDELISYTGSGSSPNCLDAMTQALMVLKPHRKRFSSARELPF